MASVNTVVIQIGDNEDMVIDILNGYLLENGKAGNKFVKVDSESSAGTKYPDKTLIWGGINYLNVQEFIDIFLSIDTTGSVMTIFNSDGDHVRVVKSKDVTVEVV